MLQRFDCHLVIIVPNLVKQKVYCVCYKNVKNLLCCVIIASIGHTDESIQEKSDYITCRFVIYFTILSIFETIQFEW
jgi:hypothetical protein